MTQVKTTDYTITDYGIAHAQYFQGHGSSCSTHACLGIGDTYAEALDDALENAAMDGFDIELDSTDQPEQYTGKGPSAQAQHDRYCEHDDHDECDHELYYYVGLRWNS